VEDFFAPTVDAYAGLLRFLLELDLIDRVTFWMLPLDNPLPWLLVDRRAMRATAVHDETWLRVVDVRAALAARGYAGDGSVTIAVNDPLLEDNSATFAVTASGIEATEQRAQLRVGIAGLGAALLGGVSWRNLAVAGVVHTDDPAALAVADRLFAVPEAPYSGTFF
jgi:predicted acetyltransferase